MTRPLVLLKYWRRIEKTFREQILKLSDFTAFGRVSFIIFSDFGILGRDHCFAEHQSMVNARFEMLVKKDDGIYFLRPLPCLYKPG
jgi:hypothetical protein